MTALYRNDAPGQHAPGPGTPPAFRPDRERAPPQKVTSRRMWPFSGAGFFTGLWAALTAGTRGAQRRRARRPPRRLRRVGTQWRAGFSIWASTCRSRRFEAKLGQARAHALWQLAEEARAQLRDFCAAHAPEASYRPGSAFAEYSPPRGRRAARRGRVPREPLWLQARGDEPPGLLLRTRQIAALRRGASGPGRRARPLRWPMREHSRARPKPPVPSSMS